MVRSGIICIAALLLALLGGTIVIGLAEAVAVPIERKASLRLAGWPEGARPIRIALLSDIHMGNRAIDPARLGTIVDQINAARPDLVVIAGDFVTGHTGDDVTERAAHLTAPLARLRAPLGAIAVLGNHDHWTGPATVRSALESAGITVLENDVVRRGPLAIFGIGDVFSGHADLAKAMVSHAGQDGIPVVLTHSPDLAKTLPKGFPLLLAGHTHCGQVVLPRLRPLLARSPLQNERTLYDARYRCGIIRDPGRTVVVTAGLGSGTAPIRIGAPPDWWLLTLGP